MSKLKVLTVLGARPQFVKAAVVSQAFLDTGAVEEIIVHTGQHFDRAMSDVFFEQMRIPAPSLNLGIGGGSHGQNTGKMLMALEEAMLECRPDAVLVYGDTDSTMAGALSSAKLTIPVVHVEAGLRSYNRAMPEEINRIVTDHVSDLLLTPSGTATANLRNEGIEEGKIAFTGDVMFDAVLTFSEVAAKSGTLLQDLGLVPGEFILATIHRKENVDHTERLGAILAGLAASPLPIVLPIHPRTRNQLAASGIELPANFRAIEPVGYLEMLQLTSGAVMVATDSGGLQKEAWFLGRPCLVLRDETEWIELVEAGGVRLAGADSAAIAANLDFALPAGRRPDIYGDGTAARRVAKAIVGAFG